MKKCLIFDFSSDFAHFKRIYTTTSSYTYLVPPKTSIVGLIGAILGFSKDNYYVLFDITKIAICLEKIPKTIVFVQNYLKTDDNQGKYDFKRGIISDRTQIPVEYVKNPKYKIFVILEDNDLFEKLKNMLITHKSYYTPYAGISECIANIEFFDEGEIGDIDSDVCDSIIVENINLVKPKGEMIIQDLYPLEITKDRTTKKTSEVCIGKKIYFSEKVPLKKVKTSKGGEHYIVQFF